MLKAVALRRLAAGQGELDLGVGHSGPTAGPLPWIGELASPR